MDVHGDGKKKKGGRMRTVTFASPKDATDAKYQQGVKKLEEAFGSRGGYVIGEGALNKNDALYMMEEDEKRRRMERARKEEEAARFKHMVARERALKDVNEESEGVSGNDADETGTGDMVKSGDGAGPVVGAARRAMGNKRRKTAKELLRVKKVGEAETHDINRGGAPDGGDGVEGGKEGADVGVTIGHAEEVGGEANGGFTSLFGEYDDSD